MKNVLWISRHTMTVEQKKDLERALGDEVLLVCWKDTLEDLQPITPILDLMDAVAAVLPLQLLAELKELAGDKPVLTAVSERRPSGKTVTLPDGRTEQEFLFVHNHWEEIQEICIRTRRLPAAGDGKPADEEKRKEG